MLDHHIQRQIVYQLAFADSLRFSELQPADLENKLFTYHLKKLVVAKLIVKLADGSYSLTSEGRRMGKGVLRREQKHVDRAYSILLLAIRRGDDWLIFKRHTHPLIGLSGFMQARPIADELATKTAMRTCKEQTNLDGRFTVHGHGFFRMYRNDELESFINFTLLICTDTTGDLVTRSEFGEYQWQASPDFLGPDMLPNMQILHKMCEDPAGQFADMTFRL